MDRIIGVIPAAGLGTRMQPLTDTLPKAMFQIGGKPLLQFALDNLSPFVSKIVIVVGYKKESIIDYIKSKKFDKEIVIVEQNILTGLPNAILAAQREINSTFAVQAPDNIFTEPINYVLEKHQKEKASTTLLLEQSERKEKAYVQLDNEGRVISISGDYSAQKLVTTGLSVHEPEFLDYCKNLTPRNGETKLLDAILKQLKDNKNVVGVLIEGKRFDITSIEDINHVQDYFSFKAT